MDEDVLHSGERALRSRWPDVRLTQPTVLDSSPRSRVLRCRVSGGDASTVVVKAHLAGQDAPPQEREAAVREPAALSVLAGRAGCVHLLGVAEGPAVVVLRDLGASGDLADLLLGSDANAAAAGVTAWATAIAQLHSAGVTGAFERALAEHAARLGVPTPAAQATRRMLGRAADSLAVHVSAVGVQLTETVRDELCDLEELLGGGPGAHALTPSDPCPDNNVLGEDAAVLLDFEGAQVRHIAWDVAYLSIPWPSCWCSWRLDGRAASRAVAAYRAAVDLPYARTPSFDDDLRAVAAGWALVSTGWFLEQALVDDHPDAPHSAVTPQRRAMITHRLAQVGEPRLPALTAFAGELLGALRDRWGEVPLELAPAFRPR